MTSHFDQDERQGIDEMENKLPVTVVRGQQQSLGKCSGG
jgi:hypothetical protein